MNQYKTTANRYANLTTGDIILSLWMNGEGSSLYRVTSVSIGEHGMVDVESEMVRMPGDGYSPKFTSNRLEHMRADDYVFTVDRAAS